MPTILSRYATPFTLGLFVVSAVSGMALFFHLAPGAFHEMHEWLSVVLLAPFALHVWKNWSPLLGYVRRRAIAVPLAASLVAAVAFAIPGAGSAGGGPPQIRAMQLLTQAPLAKLAPLLGVEPAALQASLRERGFQVDSTETTLTAVAAASDTTPERLLAAILPAH